MFTRDCYDEDRDARIAQIGQVAYDAEVKEYARKHREEHLEQYRWSTTEPKVMYRDVIAFWNTKTQKAENEAYVLGIAENGDITVRYLDGRRDGQPAIWKGEYRRMCAAIEELDKPEKQQS